MSVEQNIAIDLFLEEKIDKNKVLEEIGGEIDIQEIQSDIQIVTSENLMSFMYKGILLGFIDFQVEDCVASLEFIGNINMTQNNAELYNVEARGLEIFDEEGIRIQGLGEFMLKKFIDFLKINENEVEIITAEIDNPLIIKLFTKLKVQGIVADFSADPDKDESLKFSREYLLAYI